MGILDWLKQGLQKQRAVRYPAPRVVAHYWDGGAPKEHPVRDISLTGAYLYATERWYIGTIIEVALRELPGPDETPSGVSGLCLRCRIVRHGLDGIGISFMLRTQEERRGLKRLMIRVATNSGSLSALRSHSAAAQGRV